MKHGSFCFIRSREEFCAVMTCVTELAKRRRQVGVKVDCDFIALCPSLVKKKSELAGFFVSYFCPLTLVAIFVPVN